MYIVKGFVTNAAFISNIPGIVSAIGELSTQGMTYSREKGTYDSGDTPGMVLTTFLSAEDGVKRRAENHEAQHALLISKFIYDRTLQDPGQVFSDELAQALTLEFNEKSGYYREATDFVVGPMIEVPGGYYGSNYMPEYVSWKRTGVPENRYKIWYVDQAFRSQYDEYEIIVVPALTNLGNFYQTAVQVEAALKLVTLPVMADRIQQAKGVNSPESIVRVDEYMYIDPLNSLHRLATNWGVLIYGIAGNNVDVIKDALQAYILANSTQTRAQWMQILPDIFKRTEFVLVPRWDRYAIPNLTLQAGIYSPVSELTESIAFLKQMVPAYTPAHINNNGQVFVNPYKSIAILAIGSIENRGSAYKLTDQFPDYIAVSSTSPDFSRMELLTQNWVRILMDMLIAAEMLTMFSDVPPGMTKIVRDDVLFLVKSYDNVNYLMAVKSNTDYGITGNVNVQLPA
jgi:hypothetical protein